MPSFKIRKVFRNATKRDGTPWVSKRSGKPMVKVSLALEGIDGYASFFDESSAYEGLAPGQAIEGQIVENNGFKDFRPASPGTPKKGGAEKIMSKLDEISNKLDRLLPPQTPAEEPTAEPTAPDDDLPF